MSIDKTPANGLKYSSGLYNSLNLYVDGSLNASASMPFNTTFFSTVPSGVKPGVTFI